MAGPESLFAVHGVDGIERNEEMMDTTTLTVGMIGAGRVARTIARLALAPVELGGLREGGRLMQAGGPLIALYVVKIA